MFKQLHYGIYSLRGENIVFLKNTIENLSKLYLISRRNNEV